MGEEDTQIEHTVRMQSVLAHWTDLPAREQRILLLRFYGNMSQAEIGEQLGMSRECACPRSTPARSATCAPACSARRAKYPPAYGQ